MSGEYTRINVANNAETELDAAITDEDTSISVLDAGVFASAPMQLTLIDADGNLEIVEVGNVDESNNNLENVTRGVDGTTAQSFESGDLVEDRFNQGTYNELVGEEGFEGHDHAEAEFQQVPNNGLVNDEVTVAGNTVSLGGSTDVNYTDLLNRSHGNEDHDEEFVTTDEDVENFSTEGEEGTVAVSQGDGTLQMEEQKSSSVSNNGEQVEESPTDINFGDGLTASSDGDGTASVVQSVIEGGSKVFVQDDEPSATEVGDVWIASGGEL